MKVNVSFLNKYDYCPRLIYLEEVLDVVKEPTKAQIRGLVGHALRKELSLRQAKMVGRADSPDSFKRILTDELEKIIREAPFIYRESLPDQFTRYLPEVEEEIQKEIDLMARHLKAMIRDMGLDEARRYLTPWKIEYTVKSKNLGLKGRIDKIYRRDEVVPVELKTGNPSPGVWPGDRMQITAYSMLLEDKLEKEIPYGMVEYTRIYSQKPVLNTEKTRRDVIYTRDEVADILEGNDPGVCPHGNPNKCRSCGLQDECYRI